MKNEVYLVRGHTGQCSDSREWDVACYVNFADAEAHVAALLKLGEEFDNKVSDWSYDEDNEFRLKVHQTLDANFPEHGWTAPNYFVVKLHLFQEYRNS
jgi:hypothetical protein